MSALAQRDLGISEELREALLDFVTEYQYHTHELGSETAYENGHSHYLEGTTHRPGSLGRDELAATKLAALLTAQPQRANGKSSQAQTKPERSAK